MAQDTTSTKTLSPPDGICEITAHLIADHDWPANTPVNGEHALAHDYLHGVRRPDLADPTLTHVHRAGRMPALDAARQRGAWPETSTPGTPTVRRTVPGTWRDAGMPIILAGLAVMAVGLLLPWVSVTAAFLGQVNRNGLSTPDGKMIGVGILLMGFVAVGDLPRLRTGNAIFLLVAALAIGGVVVYDHADIGNRIADLDANPYGYAEVGYGLYVTGAGAVMAAVGAWQRLRAN